MNFDSQNCWHAAKMLRSGSCSYTTRSQVLAEFPLSGTATIGFVATTHPPETTDHGRGTAVKKDFAMSNPWLKKNPFMSMWLSGANSVANSARGSITAAAKRQSKAATTKAANDIFSMWTDAMSTSPTPNKKTRRKTKR